MHGKTTIKFLEGSLGPYTVLLTASSILRELRGTSLTITVRSPTIDSRGVPKGIYVTLRTHAVSKVKYVRPPFKKFPDSLRVCETANSPF